MGFSGHRSIVACSGSRSMVITPGGCGHASPSTCTGTVDRNSTLNWREGGRERKRKREGGTERGREGGKEGRRERERERERERGERRREGEREK